MAEPASSSAAVARPTVECVGCGGRVPAIDGPIHRYMTASPGCWQAYTELMAGALPPSRELALAVDVYAVTHPGVPGPQSTPSVWVHLITLCCVLERGWPVERAVFLRRTGADSSRAWPWLAPPASMGDVTAIDLKAAIDRGDGRSAVELTGRWVNEAWEAWRGHHAAVRARARELIATLG